MENEEKVTESVTPPTDDKPSLEEIQKEIGEMKAKKAEAESKEREYQEAIIEWKRLKEESKVEVPSGKPEFVIPKEETEIEKIEKKFKELDYAVENFAIGHPARKPFAKDEEYMGIPMLQAYFRYCEGEKVEDIFRKPWK